MKKIKHAGNNITAKGMKNFDAVDYFQSKRKIIVLAIGMLILAALLITGGYLWYYCRELKSSQLMSKTTEIDGYKALIKDSAFTKTRPLAVYCLAKEYYDKGSYEDAIITFNALVNEYPEHSLTPAGYIGLAYANEQKGDYRQAECAFNNFIKKYPDSMWINDAKDGYIRVSEALKNNENNT